MIYLIYGSEDGTRIVELPNETDLKQVMEDYGITRWRSRPGKTEWDTNYWTEGEALLIKGDIVVPKAKTKVTEWEIE